MTHNLSADFSLRDCSFEAIKPTKNAYSNKNWDMILSLMHSQQFDLQVWNVFRKRVVFFEVVNNSFVDYHNRKTDISILSNGPAYGLSYTKAIAEVHSFSWMLLNQVIKSVYFCITIEATAFCQRMVQNLIVLKQITLNALLCLINISEDFTVHIIKFWGKGIRIWLSLLIMILLVLFTVRVFIYVEWHNVI